MFVTPRNNYSPQPDTDKSCHLQLRQQILYLVARERATFPMNYRAPPEEGKQERLRSVWKRKRERFARQMGVAKVSVVFCLR